jgi:hypothetical protein
LHSLDKAGGQIYGGNIFLLPEGGEAEGEAELAPVGGGTTQQHCGESYELHCLEETGSELKLIVFQEKSSILAHRFAL